MAVVLDLHRGVDAHAHAEGLSVGGDGGLAWPLAGRKITVRVKGGKTAEFQALVRIDTPQEALYYANGGILQYVLRQLLAGKA